MNGGVSFSSSVVSFMVKPSTLVAAGDFFVGVVMSSSPSGPILISAASMDAMVGTGPLVLISEAQKKKIYIIVQPNLERVDI